MKVPLFSDPQFVDATGTGGFNAALGLVSGAIATLGTASYPAAGLFSPESMTTVFSNMNVTVGLPSPWGLVTSGGIIVHAHGIQTGQDTTSYTVNFGGLIPGTGSATAYLAATVNQIQQNPFPLTGPPPGHPSYNPNFVPSTAYATNTYSVALTAVSGKPDNINTFELFRTTLTAGQSAISVISTIGWLRASTYNSEPPVNFSVSNIMTTAQAQAVALPTVAGLSQTLPTAALAGGLSYTMVNPLAAGNWTVVAQTTDRISGATAPAASLVLPPGGAMQVWGNAVSGQWDVTGVNPLLMASLANIFTAPQTVNAAGATAGLIVSGGTTNGTGIQIIGNGATTPNKTIRVLNGGLSVVNDAYTAQILTLTDAGALSVLGGLSGTTLNTTGTAVIGSTLTVTGGTTLQSGLNVTGTLAVTGNETVSGTLGVTGAVNSGPLTSTGAVNATGNVIANGGRLRAGLGAYASGDGAAATILNDFTNSATAVGYMRFPNGWLVQWGQGTSANDVSVFFPVSFPNYCAAIAISESNAAGSWTGLNPTVHGTSSRNIGGFIHWTLGWNTAAWVSSTNTFDYIAVGW